MKKFKTMAIASTLVGVMAIGGISAYFTDADTATNTFSVGKVSVHLEEPSWEEEDPDDIIPNQTLKKDPFIINDGVNDEYVFLEVSVPYDTIKTANDDGTVNAAAKVQLFDYEVNKGWVQVGTVTDSSADGSAASGTYTYVYAYTGILNGNSKSDMEALATGQATPTLFDEVTFINAVEDQGLEETNLDIVVNAYGIQTENIVGVDGSTPSTVWAVVQNANPSKEK